MGGIGGGGGRGGGGEGGGRNDAVILKGERWASNERVHGIRKGASMEDL